MTNKKLLIIIGGSFVALLISIVLLVMILVKAGNSNENQNLMPTSTVTPTVEPTHTTVPSPTSEQSHSLIYDEYLKFKYGFENEYELFEIGGQKYQYGGQDLDPIIDLPSIIEPAEPNKSWIPCFFPQVNITFYINPKTECEFYNETVHGSYGFIELPTTSEYQEFTYMHVDYIDNYNHKHFYPAFGDTGINNLEEIEINGYEAYEYISGPMSIMRKIEIKLDEHTIIMLSITIGSTLDHLPEDFDIDTLTPNFEKEFINAYMYRLLSLLEYTDFQDN